jgi:hypothetical protein
MLSDYQLHHGSNPHFSFEFISPSILTKTAWPAYSKHKSLNASIENALSNREKEMLSGFEQLYGSKFQGRKLEWIHCMSSLEVSFGKKMIDLPLVHFLVLESVSTQMPSANTWDNLLTLSRMPEEHFSMAMHDLIKHGLIRQVKENYFVLSMDKCPQNLKISLPIEWLFSSQKYSLTTDLNSTLTTACTSTSNRSNDYQLAEEKRQILQSAIVRIMKREKEIEHSNLLVQVRHELERSKISLSIPSTASIKQSIEFLIEKQYIERDPLKHDIYLYLA